MEHEDYHFDIPSFVGFANTENESSLYDYFFQEEHEPHQIAKGNGRDSHSEQDEASDDDDSHQNSRTVCPSPKKKQRMDLPRRSPRIAATGKIPTTAVTHPQKYKSTEEMELEKIAMKREELAKGRKNHEMTYKKAIAKGNPVVVKSSQPPTLPQGFHFQSDTRIKGTSGVGDDAYVKDFTKTLRTALPNVGASKGTTKSGPTRPKPFNLTAAKSYSALSTAEKYISTAEHVHAYKDRFRSNSHGRGTPTSQKRAESPCLTIAKTPALSTRGRSRSLKTLTRDEEEELEFEQHKKQQFKAHPVNHRILKEPQRGVPRVPVKPPTEPKEFNLHSNASHSQKHAKEPVVEEVTEFHAHGVNRKILEGPTGVKPAEKKPLTVAQSPAFSLRSRLRARERIHSQEEADPPPAGPKVAASKPMSHSGVPFRPQLEHKFTVPEPFVVEQHSKEMLRKKEHKIKQILEEEKKAREFVATLLPSDSPDQLPAKKTRPVTAPEPFQLTVDERGKKYKEQWKSKIEEEMDQARAKVQFHASSSTVCSKAPFIPDRSNRPLTEMSCFTLNTDQRAAQREQYNQQLKAHEAEIEAMKRQYEEMKEKEESKAISKLRQDMVHKATAIKKYKQVQPQPSDRPLTDAQSPFLRTQKLRSRDISE